MNLKHISDSWERGNPYEQYIGRWSRQIAPMFLRWMNIDAGYRWLDVGCGTGALCAAIVDHCSPARVAGVEPSAGFLKTAMANLAGRAALFQGTATAIALAPSSVDVVVSGLVLNFVSDPRSALLEMARVTHNGGTIGAYVWDYAGKMEMLRLFWDTAAEHDPAAAQLDEGLRFPLCNPTALQELFAGVGLSEVNGTAIDLQTTFASFEAYWQPFLGGQGPAPAYVKTLDAKEKASLREGLRDRIPTQADGSISLIARAWAVRGNVTNQAARGTD